LLEPTLTAKVPNCRIATLINEDETRGQLSAIRLPASLPIVPAADMAWRDMATEQC